jgi:hypothetical protein
MHEPGARHPREARIVRQQRVLQRTRGIARARVDDHSGRFVDDQDRRILMHDVERHPLRLDPGFGDDAGLDDRHLAPDHPVTGTDREAVHAHGPLLNPALNARA